MRRLLLAGSALVLLAGCGDASKEANYTESDGDSYAREEAAQANSSGVAGGFTTDVRGGEQLFAQAADAPAAPPPPPPPEAQPQPDGQPADDIEQAGRMLAYSYGATLQLPSRNVRSVLEQHQAVCAAAGPSRCQLLSANVNESGPDYVYGYLSLRAEPTWLAEFRAGLESDAEGADGRVVGQTVNAQDLTFQIVDTEARLETQRTLRGQLEELLRRQTDDVGDLLQVEREIARVQGDIDSQAAQLAVMRRRVEMSTLDVSYQPAPIPFSESAWTPLGRALNGFFSTFAEAAGGIVTLIAFLLPWTLIAAPLVWLLRRWWRARRAKKLAAAGT
jgi:hypothetical protein